MNDFKPEDIYKQNETIINLLRSIDTGVHEAKKGLLFVILITSFIAGFLYKTL